MPSQTLEVNPRYAERRELGEDDEVDVRLNGTSVRARVRLRERVPDGTGFLVEGLGDAAASLSGRSAEVIPAGGEAE
jgi:anaerobic selenocysteine-containing dehydrogenase